MPETPQQQDRFDPKIAQPGDRFYLASDQGSFRYMRAGSFMDANLAYTEASLEMRGVNPDDKDLIDAEIIRDGIDVVHDGIIASSIIGDWRRERRNEMELTRERAFALFRRNSPVEFRRGDENEDIRQLMIEGRKLLRKK